MTNRQLRSALMNCRKQLQDVETEILKIRNILGSSESFRHLMYDLSPSESNCRSVKPNSVRPRRRHLIVRKMRKVTICKDIVSSQPPKSGTS
jgi:hypothetical protein